MALIFPHHPDRYSAVRGWPHWEQGNVTVMADHERALQRAGGEAAAGPHARPVADALHVSLGRTFLDPQPAGDLAVGQAVGDQGRDLELPCRERGRWSLSLLGGQRAAGRTKEPQDLADHRRGVAGEHPVAPAGERNQPRPGDPGRQVASQPVGNGPVVAPVQHQRGRGDAVEEVVDTELVALRQQLGGNLGGRGPALQLGEAHLGLRCAVGEENVGQHVRTEPPVRPDQLDHGRADLGRGDVVTIGEAAVQNQASDPFRALNRVRQRHGRPHREPEQVDPAEPEVVDHRPEHLQVAVERLGCRPGVGEPTARLVVGHHGPAGGDRGVEGAHGRVPPRDLQVTNPGRRDDQRETSSDDGVRHPHARGRDDKADLAALTQFARLAPYRVDHRHPSWTGREIRRCKHRAGRRSRLGERPGASPRSCPVGGGGSS